MLIIAMFLNFSHAMEGGHPQVTAFFAGKALQALSPVSALLPGTMSVFNECNRAEVSEILQQAIATESSFLGVDVQETLTASFPDLLEDPSTFWTESMGINWTVVSEVMSEGKDQH
jgi:hypothetical protein